MSTTPICCNQACRQRRDCPMRMAPTKETPNPQGGYMPLLHRMREGLQALTEIRRSKTADEQTKELATTASYALTDAINVWRIHGTKEPKGVSSMSYYVVCSHCGDRTNRLAAGQLCHACQRGFMKPEGK